MMTRDLTKLPTKYLLNGAAILLGQICAYLVGLFVFCLFEVVTTAKNLCSENALF